MGKGSGSGGFYAVATGREVGVYRTWAEAEAQVKGFSGAKFKKFPTEAEAKAFAGQTPTVDDATSTTAPTTSLKRPRIDDAAVATVTAPGPKRLQQSTPTSGSTSTFYVVAEGHATGVFTRWPEVLQRTEGYDRPVFRKFSTREAAEAYLSGYSRAQEKVKTTAAKPRTTKAVKPPSHAPAHVDSPLSDTNSVASSTGSSGSSTTRRKFWYAVAKGRKTGVFDSWAEAKEHIDGLYSARYKKFANKEDAEAFVKSYHDSVGHQSGDPDPKHPDTLVAFCDGSALQNGRFGCQAGYACIFPHNSSWNIAQKLVEDRATNNRAEYMAALEGLKRANAEDPTAKKPLYIFSDSMLLIRSMTEWIGSWQKKNWIKADGNPVLNRDLLELLVKERGERRVIWRHVKAHTGRTDWQSKWNDVADNAARNAAAGWQPNASVSSA